MTDQQVSTPPRRALDELYAAVKRLAAVEDRQSHGSHRFDHPPADCVLCRDWTLAVVQVARLGERMFYPLPDVERALLELPGRSRSEYGR